MHLEFCKGMKQTFGVLESVKTEGWKQVQQLSKFNYQFSQDCWGYLPSRHSVLEGPGFHFDFACKKIILKIFRIDDAREKSIDR